MSKFLKFLVHFIIICMILCVLAIFLPPLFGIKTTVMDGTYKDTNLVLGSVTYSREVSMGEIQQGDSLAVVEGTAAHRYDVISLDSTKGTCTVKDPTISGDGTLTISVKNGAWRALFSVEVIGFLLVAVQSRQGLVILGLAVLILIILYIIAELWKKEPSEKERPEEGSAVYVKTDKELKEEDKLKERQRREEEKAYLAEKKSVSRETASQRKMRLKQEKVEEKAKKKEERARRKAMKTVRTGGFIDEIEEEDLELEAEEQDVSNVQAATSEAHEELKKEIAAATAEVPEEPSKEQPLVDIPPELVQQPKAVPEETKAEEPPMQEDVRTEPPKEIKKMAIPLYTAAALAEKVRASGDAPEVMRDEISKVVLFDYSDIIVQGSSESKE